MKKLYVADRETGTFMDEVSSVDEGIKLIRQFEDEDKANDDYVEGFYEIVNEEHETVFSDYYGISREKA